MVELSSGKFFYDKKHDWSLSSAICNGLCPEFGEGTPEFYKALAYRCMSANPTISKLYYILSSWRDSYQEMVKKSRKPLKKLMRRYQIYRPYTKRILMLNKPVEHLHLVICRNLMIRLLLFHILKKIKWIVICNK